MRFKEVIIGQRKELILFIQELAPAAIFSALPGQFIQYPVLKDVP